MSEFPALIALDNERAVHPLTHVDYSTPGCQCADIFQEVGVLVFIVYCKDYKGEALCTKLCWGWVQHGSRVYPHKSLRTNKTKQNMNAMSAGDGRPTPEARIPGPRWPGSRMER